MGPIRSYTNTFYKKQITVNVEKFAINRDFCFGFKFPYEPNLGLKIKILCGYRRWYRVPGEAGLGQSSDISPASPGPGPAMAAKSEIDRNLTNQI